MHANPNPNLFMDTFNLNKRYSIFPVSHHFFQRVIETAGEKKSSIFTLWHYISKKIQAAFCYLLPEIWFQLFHFNTRR